MSQQNNATNKGINKERSIRNNKGQPSSNQRWDSAHVFPYMEQVANSVDPIYMQLSVHSHKHNESHGPELLFQPNVQASHSAYGEPFKSPDLDGNPGLMNLMLDQLG